MAQEFFEILVTIADIEKSETVNIVLFWDSLKTKIRVAGQGAIIK